MKRKVEKKTTGVLCPRSVHDFFLFWEDASGFEYSFSFWFFFFWIYPFWGALGGFSGSRFTAGL